ncbi:hypothetical protein STSP2_01548 [Anaerohalosphaera lusitana]|uniref:DUF6677 domain-containing protein n=1 Tax=Anaerohalosphaera lusitana TaxID=1936003 RepID=A0A1U9NKY5_9BACT|nr:DUF6677 family protein [Anaerohalosphaera lusitana]AQT68388.1 hypothetical protein STSP2_01548 [Anaerohalosphaera lusitana]
MPNRSGTDHTIFLLTVGALAWIIPGAGHFMIKEKRRGAIICVTILSTFAIGLFVGSIAVVNPNAGGLWYIGQMLVSPLVAMVGQMTASKGLVVYGRESDIGQIYTTVAGLLNLLCVISAVYMAHSGRGEIIGEEEEDVQ